MNIWRYDEALPGDRQAHGLASFVFLQQGEQFAEYSRNVTAIDLIHHQEELSIWGLFRLGARA